MGRHTLDGKPPIDVILRTSGRARRLSLRLSRLDGRATLTIPATASQAEAIGFLRTKEAWLRRHIADIAPPQAAEAGGRVLFAGQERPVVIDPGTRARLMADGFHVPDGRTAGARIKGILRARAREALTEASDDYAAMLGLTYRRITLRDTRSRWGSCTADGALMYSWRLIMAPPEVLAYVAAHEVAHLAEMNHSPAFWAVVTRLYGDYAPPRRWLRENGDKLHRISFGD